MCFNHRKKTVLTLLMDCSVKSHRASVVLLIKIAEAKNTNAPKKIIGRTSPNKGLVVSPRMFIVLVQQRTSKKEAQCAPVKYFNGYVHCELFVSFTTDWQHYYCTNSYLFLSIN